MIPGNNLTGERLVITLYNAPQVGPGRDLLSGYTFAFYAVCMIGQLICVLLLMRETKGVSLEEIQKQMGTE